MATGAFSTTHVFVFLIASCEAVTQGHLPDQSAVSSVVIRSNGEVSRPASTDSSLLLEGQQEAPTNRLTRRETGRGVTRDRSANDNRKNKADGKRTWHQTRQQRDLQVQGLLMWLSAQHCSKKCGINRRREWEKLTDDPCKTECLAGVNRLKEAGDAVQPGDEHPIEFPMTESSKVSLHRSNDGTEYDGMMFAGGVKLHDKISFVARLCTHGCHHDPARGYFDSTAILGELELNGTHGSPGASWLWKHAAEHWVPHDDGVMAKGDFVGPEDPRMDVLLGNRFLTLSLNIPSHKIPGCPIKTNKVGIRHMFFVPVDDTKNYKTCDIQIPGVDRCRLQKNWTPLVPRGSKDVYYVYSIRPLSIMRLKPTSCETSWVGEAPVQFRGTGVHGGTRYVFGKQVDEGDLFFSIGHTPSPQYQAVLVALLVRNATTAEDDPKIELVGISCPVHASKKFRDIVYNGGSAAEQLLLIPTSIIDFEPKADVSTITYQVHDREHYRSELFGIGSWLQTAYKEFKNGNVFQCDQVR